LKEAEQDEMGWGILPFLRLYYSSIVICFASDEFNVEYCKENKMITAAAQRRKRTWRRHSTSASQGG